MPGGNERAPTGEKPSSSSGLIRAGNSGSVAAVSTMPSTARPNTFAYGRTYESRRRYSSLLSVIQLAVKIHQLAGHRIEAEALGSRARGRAERLSRAQRRVRLPDQPRDAGHVVRLADPAVHAGLDHFGRAAARAHDRRQPHRERFQRGVRKRIVAARQQEAVRRRIVRPHVLAAAQETHSIRGFSSVFVFAHYDEPIRSLLDRRHRRIESLARKTGADEREYRVARAAADLGARRAAPAFALARMEMIQVHAVVDHVQLFRRDPEIALDLLAHHLRIADHRAQARMLEHALLGAAHVMVVRVERHAGALERARRGAPQREPAPVHAVAGAVDVAARDALVRLHHVEMLALPGAARGARERPVAPQVTDV